MKYPFKAETSTFIKAEAAKVWEALTKPELVKKYFFNVDLITDWKVGSPITYRGEWEGLPFEEKGHVIKVEPLKTLVSSYYSPNFANQPDLQENYQIITYKLEPENDGTRLTLTQENVISQEAADHSKKNWTMVLDGLKKLLENG